MSCLFGRPLRRSLLAAGLLAAFSVHAQTTPAAIDLPAAPLDQSLSTLAREAGVQILFASDVAGGKTAQALKGRFTPREALDRLLAGQRLEALERGPGVYVVRRVEAKPLPPKTGRAVKRALERSETVDEPDTSTLETIVVTGEKTDRSLQDTTTSVAVTTAERIDDENIRSLYDILGRTANVSLGDQNNDFNIRGMSRQGSGQAQQVSIYMDGAALPDNNFAASGPYSTWDLDQVEILRGAQSTIQGESAIGGAIVLHTKDPTMVWEAHARAQYSNPAARDLAFAGGGPLIADELAFRVSVEGQDSNGFVSNPVRDEKHADAWDQTTFRAKLLWTPEALPGLTAKLSLTHDNYAGPLGLPMAVYTSVPDYFRHREHLTNMPDDQSAHNDIANAEVDYEFSPAWKLSSVTSWARTDVTRHFDTDGTAADTGVQNLSDHPRTVQQEFRLHYGGDRLQGLLGAYFSQRDDSTSGNGRQILPTPTNTIITVLQAQGLSASQAASFADLYTQALPVIPLASTTANSDRDRNEALFGDGTLNLTEHWSLLGGFRYDRQQYTLGANNGIEQFLGTYPDPAAYGAAGSLPYQIIAGINQAVAQYIQNAGARDPAGTRDFDAFLPKLGVRYAWSKDMSLAFVFQRGSRAGGSYYDLARNEIIPYDPEYTRNYEFAFRSQWLDDKLTLNANLYRTDWKDKIVFVFGSLGNYDAFYINANSARMWGFEVEANWRVNAHFDWYATLGHQRTRYGNFDLPEDVTTTDLTGKEFADAPQWTAALGANWRFADGWFLNGNASFRDREVGNSSVAGDAGMLATLFLLNGRFGYQKDNWSAYLFGSNLLNRRYQRAVAATFATTYLGDPRIVGIGVEAHW